MNNSFNTDTVIYVGIAALGSAQAMQTWDWRAVLGVAIVALTAWKAKRSPGKTDQA